MENGFEEFTYALYSNLALKKGKQMMCTKSVQLSF